MPQRTDSLDLGRLSLPSGSGRTLELHVAIEPFDLGGTRYPVGPDLVPARLDVSRTASSGYALRLRFAAALTGPCMRCLGPAEPEFDVDSYEIEQPGGGDELRSPYVDEAGELDVSKWARDALALALPTKIVCSPDCRGLCPRCGVNLNDEPDHAHEPEPDPRWAKLSEIKFD